MTQKDAVAGRFSKMLKTLRKSHKLSQAELADALGVSRGSISYYENRERIPDIAFLSLVQRYFKVGFDELLGNADIAVDALYAHLEEQLRSKPPELSLRTLSRMERRIQKGIALQNSRYFITILQRYLLEGTRSVVFHITRSEEYYTLQMSCPLSDEEYSRIAEAGCAPVLRSNVPFAVELLGSPCYVAVMMNRSLSTCVEMLANMMLIAKKELERVLLSK